MTRLTNAGHGKGSVSRSHISRNPVRRYSPSSKSLTATSVRASGRDPERIQKEYDSILMRNFSRKERDHIKKDGGMEIIVEELDDGILAEYVGKKKGKHRIYVNKIDPVNEETICHETIHVLDECSPDRPHLNRQLKGKTLTLARECLKEALTEAETVSRVDRIFFKNPPYYDRIEKNPRTVGKSDEQMKMEDRKLLTCGTGKGQGSRSVKIVEEKFDMTNISNLKLYDGVDVASCIKKHKSEHGIFRRRGK